MSHLIGIDLGTTNSLCAVFESGAPRLIPNAVGRWLTPSVVGILEDGHVIVGEAARDYRITATERTAAGFKRRMGENRAEELGNKRLTAIDLSALVLRSLVQDAEADLGSEIREAVVTVPAYFNETQRRATKLAGEQAGLVVRRIVNEPTAAALAYGLRDRESTRTLLVFDLGGGTFDVTVMDAFEGSLETLATAGESFLGGEDLTDRLVARALERVGMAFEITEHREPLRVARLRAHCEAAKLALSEHERATVRMPSADGTLAEDAKVLEFERAEFEEVVAPLMQRLARPLDRALRDAGKRRDDIDDVILVGGATRTPAVRTFVRDRLGREPLTDHDPDHVVALGAAVQAALIEDDAAVDDLVMTDVCPFTLGVAVCKEFGPELRDGYYLPVIDRGTTIPVSREQVVCTIHRNQTQLTLRVYQGESRRVEENLLLGELEVPKLPPGPKGQSVHVRFTYDLNGILEVEAYVPKTGARQAIVLEQHVEGLSRRELARAVREMQKLKFYPRDDLENQRLVRFAERVVGEVSPLQRGELEQAIDAFEQSMAQSSQEAYQAVRSDLVMILSALGFPFESGEEPRDEPEG